MNITKTEEEIALMRENGILVSRTLAEVGRHIEPGVTTSKLNDIAEAFIRDHGAVPAFLGYNGFPFSLCISVNSVVVHGFPSDYRMQEGDIVSIDCGTKYKGYFGDSAYTFGVGKVSQAAELLMRTTRESLFRGIGQATAGNRIGDIGAAVQTYVEQHGFSVVREMVGHGIGTRLHEKPDVPNYGSPGQGKRLEEGMVLCIEPMINEGGKGVYMERDGWTLRTADNRNSAHYELTVVVRKGKAELLSTFAFIEGEDMYK
ncbi:MAG: Methionine aminopeptidase 1 [Bacteroidetes bacterium ADurb.Bin037]|mgnify:CR=1 FL=1|nr:MAG: Methionine aminopeptidase 1 [Bacteroidetes bacterium ADurb.Bin037]HPW78142.1 type I methionyl aminopeptidase [Bacteroidales bacterium]HQB56627.1 type I methionyl aminopeptidase [Bacteroidales bacterium]